MCLARNCKVSRHLSVSLGQNRPGVRTTKSQPWEPLRCWSLWFFLLTLLLCLHQKLSPTRNVEKQRWVGWGAGAEW